MRRGRRVVVACAALALALVGSACGPKPGLEVGMKDYDTEIIFGGKKKIPPLPPPPAPVYNPSFPGLIELPVPVVPPDSPPSLPPPPPPPRCKAPNLSFVPPPPPPAIDDRPSAGLYTFRAEGRRVVSGVDVPVYGVQIRTVRHSPDDPSTYEVEVSAPGEETAVSTYSNLRPLDDSSLDGLYLRRVVQGDRVFEPLEGGLRIFAQPASVGTTWTSSATAPLARTSMRAEGIISGVTRLNICGELVEGWVSKVSVDIDSIDPDTGGVVSSHLDAEFVVLPQYGGLIVEDRVVQTTGRSVDAAGTPVGEARFFSDVKATAESLSPAPA